MPLPGWISDLRALDVLISVAELGSVGRAAVEHGISQPSASARLARLERQLGVELLTRTTRGSRLTPSGEVVVAWARDVVGAAQAMAEDVVSLRADGGGHLGVAASLTVAEYLLPGWLLTLRRERPGIGVSVTVANSHDVVDAVRAGRAELGFVETPDLPSGLQRAAIGSDDVVLVARPGTLDDPMGAQDLEHVPLLLREPGSGTRETFVRGLTDLLGRTPELSHATDLGSTAVILATARAGGGVGVISARAAAAGLRSGELEQRSVDGLDLARPLTAIWRGRPSPLAVALVALARADVAGG